MGSKKGASVSVENDAYKENIYALIRLVINGWVLLKRSKSIGEKLFCFLVHITFLIKNRGEEGGGHITVE